MLEVISKDEKKLKSKKLSINSLRNKIKTLYFKNIEEIKSSNMKTLLVKVLEELPQYVDSENTEILTKVNKDKLLELMDDAHSKRIEYLKWCEDKFHKNPLFFIENASKPVYIKKQNLSLIIYLNEQNEKIKTEFTCPKCGDAFYVHFYADFKGKEQYVACCKNNEHQETGIKLDKKKEIVEKEDSKEEVTNFEISSFKAKKLYGKLYSELLKGKSLKNYGAANCLAGIVYNVSKEICSFLDKFYGIKKEHIKINKINENNYKKIVGICENNNIEFDFQLETDFTKKEEIEVYNNVISQINMWLNENIHQKEIALKKDAPKFKRLKGFPSFPLVEKIDEKHEEEKLLDELLSILSEYEQNSLNYWKNLPLVKFTQLIEKLKPYKETKNKQKSAIEQVYYLFKHYAVKYNFENTKDIGNLYQKVIEKIDIKINQIQNHLESSKDDARSKKALTEWLIAKSVLFLEYLRDTNSIKFYQEREKFNKLSSLNKGFIFKKEHENKTFEIMGFSGQYKASIIRKDLQDGNSQYSVVFNPYNEGVFKINEKDYNCFGFAKKKGEEEIEDGKKEESKTGLYPLKINTEKAITLPLAFGKRQGREYLWNKIYKLEKGDWELSNARIIQRLEYDKKSKTNKKVHYVAITFNKNKCNDFKAFDEKYNAIIGVDRGEKIPVVASVVDLDGNLIETKLIGAEHNKKQKDIQDKKEKQQSQTGKYGENLTHKAKNIADNMVKTTAVELLNLAVKYNAIIVFENLSRGFGRGGRRTIMADKQYTKIEDYLVQKLAFEGIYNDKSKILTNTRNGLFAKIVAQYTSQICSKCGEVFTGKDSDYYLDNLAKLETGKYQTLLKNDEAISLDIDYEYWSNKYRQDIKTNANEEIEKILNAKEIKDLSETTKKKVKAILGRALNPRKTQAKFKCPICNNEVNADEQASLNIARVWLFVKGEEVDALKSNIFEKGKRYKGTKEKNLYDKDKTKYPYLVALSDFYKRMLESQWLKQN